MKKYNSRRHYETHHAERYRGLQGQPRREKVKELIAGLKKQPPFLPVAEILVQQL